jgi:uncharacterized protein (TIGR00251 family)
MKEWYQIIDGSVHINLKVIPGASKNEITGIRDNRLCVRIAASPVKGKANTCLCEFIAKNLGCAKREISVISGEKSRCKIVSIPLAFNKKLMEFV